MYKFCFLIFLFILFTGCNQNSSQVERDYLKNLEEKNKVLEQELQDMKDRSKSASNSKRPSSEVKSPKGYFTIGSSENEVIEIMGTPKSYIATGPGYKTFFYGLSTVDFYKGKVMGYNNFDGNLKVKVTP